MRPNKVCGVGMETGDALLLLLYLFFVDVAAFPAHLEFIFVCFCSYFPSNNGAI